MNISWQTLPKWHIFYYQQIPPARFWFHIGLFFESHAVFLCEEPLGYVRVNQILKTTVFFMFTLRHLLLLLYPFVLELGWL